MRCVRARLAYLDFHDGYQAAMKGLSYQRHMSEAWKNGFTLYLNTTPAQFRLRAAPPQRRVRR